jgi:hypothetical protein
MAILPSLVFAQESEPKERLFSVGLTYSPNYSYRHLSYGSESESLVKWRERYEEPSFGFNAGIAAQYRFGKRFEVVLGVQYSEQGSAFREIELISIEGTQLGSYDSEFVFSYIEVPLRANYHVLDRKVFAYVTLGASANFFQSDEVQSTVTWNDGDTEESTSATDIVNFNQIAYALIGGFGVGTSLHERWEIRLEPIFRYSITPVADAPIDQHNYSIGGQFGVYFKI